MTEDTKNILQTIAITLAAWAALIVIAWGAAWLADPANGTQCAIFTNCQEAINGNP